MRVADFDYELPADLIAQEPPARRGESRMLVLPRAGGPAQPTWFKALGEYLRPGDCLVLNDTRVLKARLHGSKEGTGAKVEALVLHELSPGVWEALLRPARRLPPGTRVRLAADGTGFTVGERVAHDTFALRFDDAAVPALLERHGALPLPPYIQRPATGADEERYQTVFASQPGAVAAPTAGLHFTPEHLAELAAMGVRQCRVTLHVGLGTFQPVSVDEVTAHVMHAERFDLPATSAALINATRAAGARVIAIGTTAVRVLESQAQADGTVMPGSGETRLFLYPPYQPKVVDGLLTNFHLPRSTLLMLVSTFATRERVLAAYQQAVAAHWRFFSYGDCMLLL